MKVHQLDHGLKVVLAPMSSPSVTVMAMVGVGSRFETEQSAGLSHFLEHMVFKGTKQYPTSRDVSIAIEGVGADFNAFTGKEYTAFYVTSTAAHIDRALNVISDMLYEPKLRTADLEREKGVIVEEINMYRDMPSDYVGELFDQLMYGAEQGLGRPIVGTKESVTAFSRDDFKTHLDNWYGLDNTVVVLAGNEQELVQTEKMLERVSAAFGRGEVYGDTNIERRLGYKDAAEVSMTVYHKESDQAHFQLGFPAFAYNHPDKDALTLLSAIAGGNMSSRLFTEVREKRGLAYYSHTGLDRYFDIGSFVASCGVDVKRVDEAVKVTLEVFMSLLSDGKEQLTQEELDRAKEFVCGQFMLSLESSRNIARYWAAAVTLGLPLVTPAEVVARIKSVQLEDVRRVAHTVINTHKLVFALVGPYKEPERFDRLIRV